MNVCVWSGDWEANVQRFGVKEPESVIYSKCSPLTIHSAELYAEQRRNRQDWESLWETA